MLLNFYSLSAQAIKLVLLSDLDMFSIAKTFLSSEDFIDLSSLKDCTRKVASSQIDLQVHNIKHPDLKIASCKTPSNIISSISSLSVADDNISIFLEDV